MPAQLRGAEAAQGNGAEGAGATACRGWHLGCRGARTCVILPLPLLKAALGGLPQLWAQCCSEDRRPAAPTGWTYPLLMEVFLHQGIQKGMQCAAAVGNALSPSAWEGSQQVASRKPSKVDLEERVSFRVSLSPSEGRPLDSSALAFGGTIHRESWNSGSLEGSVAVLSCNDKKVSKFSPPCCSPLPGERLLCPKI